LKKEYETQREGEKKEFTVLKKNFAVLEDIVQRQVKQIQALKASAKDSTSAAQENTQTGKSLNQQLNDALNERTLQGQQLKQAAARIAELEEALLTNQPVVPAVTFVPPSTSTPAPTPAPAAVPPCTHNPEDFIEKWKFLRQRELAQQELGKKIATINDLGQKNNVLKRQLLESKADNEKYEKLEYQVLDQEKTIEVLQEDNEYLQNSVRDLTSRIEETTESYNLEIEHIKADSQAEKRALEEAITRYRQTTVDRGSYLCKIAELNDATAEIEQLEESIEEIRRKKDDEINRLQAQVEQLNGTITEAETDRDEENQLYEAQIERFEYQIKWYQAELQGQKAHIEKLEKLETQTSKDHDLAAARIPQLEEENSQLKEQLNQLQQQISEFVKAAESRFQEEQANGAKSQRLYKKYKGKADQLQQEVKQVKEVLLDYEAQAQAHVCAPAVPDPYTVVQVRPTEVLSFSTYLRCESSAPATEFEAAYAELIAATERWSTSDEESVPDHSAPAPATEAFSYPSSASDQPFSSSLLSTPPSTPLCASASASASTPAPAPPLLTPPSSPPTPAYDPRVDVPDIESWWFDEERFAASWPAATFEYKRAIPYCDNCRTRRALRPGPEGEWKVPAACHHRRRCDEHRFWAWDPECPACIEADSPSSQEEQLPERLRQKYKCRGYSCPPHHDLLQQQARFLLAEGEAFEEARRAAWWRHQELLDKYRAVYGRAWPAHKDE
jgi:hypothetical protein